MEWGRAPEHTAPLAAGRRRATLLRDLIRAVSDGEGSPALRVGVADEQGELAAMYQGSRSSPSGGRPTCWTAAQGAGTADAPAGMNPQVLAADEITAPEDAAALEMAANCGVSLLCTAHAGSLEGMARPCTAACWTRGCSGGW